METFSALLALCAGNSPVSGEFPSQRPVTRSFDVFFNLRLNKGLSKQSWGWWFETPSCSLWRHCNARSRYFRQGQVIASHNILCDPIANPCLGYLILAPKSSNVKPCIIEIQMSLQENKYTLFNHCCKKCNFQTYTEYTWCTGCAIAVMWMPQNVTKEKSTLVQVIAWYHHVTSLYLSQFLPRTMLPYGISQQQWIKVI